MPTPSRTTSCCRRPARSTSSRRIRNQMLEAGIPIEFSKGEAGVGQHEINITYGDALEVADRHLVFKNGVKEIAARVRAGGHLHGQVVDGRPPARRATSTRACGTRPATPADGAGRRRRDAASGFSELG